MSNDTDNVDWFAVHLTMLFRLTEYKFRQLVTAGNLHAESVKIFIFEARSEIGGGSSWGKIAENSWT